MRYYAINGATNPDGSHFDINLGQLPQPTVDSLTRVWAKDGVTLNVEHTHNISDKPVFRFATEEELAEGSGRYIKN